MNQDEVVALMESSSSEEEWNANCAKIKAAFNGYPNFWYNAIIMSGVADRTATKWGGDAKIRITAYKVE